MTHCRLGDLAITINCDVQENLGRIVRVIGIKGLKPWRDKGEVFVWEVEAISEASPLIYKYDQCLIEALRGPVPDTFLRPIRGEESGAEEVAFTLRYHLPKHAKGTRSTALKSPSPHSNVPAIEPQRACDGCFDQVSQNQFQ
jgi:hypothetical protein